MKRIFCFLLLLAFSAGLHAVPVFRLYGGYSMPRHSYLPPGPAPKLSRYPGFTFGVQMMTKVHFSTGESDISSASDGVGNLLIGFDYCQKGGKVALSDGTKMQTRFNAPGFEIGAMSNPRHSHWFNAGVSLYAGYILNGERTLTSASGVDSTFALKIGNETTDHLRPVIIGFKLHLLVTTVYHVNLGVTFQGSPVELSNNDMNLRDKGIQLTLGYYFYKEEE
jgi:hypothetical protein